MAASISKKEVRAFKQIPPTRASYTLSILLLGKTDINRLIPVFKARYIASS